MTRTIDRKVRLHPPHPGFIGAGHEQVHVVEPTALAASDPFVLLEDDRLEIRPRRQIGGAHPHAGLETVTLVLEGELDDRDEGRLGPGDLIWMTAGRGIIHSEAIEVEGRSRILQLWIALPARARDLAPSFQLIRAGDAPRVHGDGVEGRLYSGALGELRAPTRNVVPTIVLDLTLAPGAAHAVDLPADHNGFLYVLDGELTSGDTTVARGEVGWSSPAAGPLALRAGARGARVVLYAGQPLGEPLVQHGPFVAGDPLEVRDYYRRFRLGEFVPMSTLSPS